MMIKYLSQWTLRIFLILAFTAGVPPVSAQSASAVFNNCKSLDTMAPEIPKAECEALVTLYNSTNGGSWTNRKNWLQTDAPCSWFGVTCAAGHVTSLDLGSNQLNGPIPAALGSLKYLTRLALDYNLLYGSIPPQLGRLTNLISLNLSWNQLSGSIPADLGSLTNLTSLKLGSNALSGSIPPQLGALKKLYLLDLGSNQLSGSIPAQLGGLASLEGLSLWSNTLSGPIPAELGGLKNLISLNLDSNQLSGPIPAPLGELTNLTYLYLGNNLISESIPAQLGGLTNLTNLNLRSNQLSGPIPRELGSLTGLIILNLGSNQLSDPIPLELGSLTGLKYLHLDSNALSGSFPAELGSLTYLIALGFSANELNGEFPAAITNLVNLNYLYFDFCRGLGSSAPAVIAFLEKKAPYWNDCDQSISGNAGIGGATLSYTDGLPKTAAADINGDYSFPVTYFWSGIVTPSKGGFTFSPVQRSYTHVIDDQTEQNYITTGLTLSSIAAQDGWVLESTETSKVGGTFNATDTTIRLGDDPDKKQYLGILSFKTFNLPDNALITKVTLKVRKQSITGGENPVTTFQGFMADIKNGFFGNPALQAADFQAPAGKSLGPFAPAPAGGWYSLDLTDGKDFINKLGTDNGLTQIRLRFKLDDNNNSIANYLNLFSGNAPAESLPLLTIEYQLP